jgi:hypothetical protein
VVGLTKAVGVELAQTGVTCVAICPGYVKTPLVEGQIVDQAKARGMSEDKVLSDVILAAQPTKKFVEYEHLAGLLRYLVSDAGASATGAGVVGGRRLDRSVAEAAMAGSRRAVLALPSAGAQAQVQRPSRRSACTTRRGWTSSGWRPARAGAGAAQARGCGPQQTLQSLELARPLAPIVRKLPPAAARVGAGGRTARRQHR